MGELIHQAADQAVRPLKVRELDDQKADEYAGYIFHSINDRCGTGGNKRLVNFIDESVKAGD